MFRIPVGGTVELDVDVICDLMEVESTFLCKYGCLCNQIKIAFSILFNNALCHLYDTGNFFLGHIHQSSQSCNILKQGRVLLLAQEREDHRVKQECACKIVAANALDALDHPRICHSVRGGQEVMHILCVVRALCDAVEVHPLCLISLGGGENSHEEQIVQLRHGTACGGMSRIGMVLRITAQTGKVEALCRCARISVRIEFTDHRGKQICCLL